MKIKSKIDLFIEKIVMYGSFINLILLVVAWIGCEINETMIIYITVGIFFTLLILSLYNLIRMGNYRNNEFAFIRTFLNSEDWRKMKQDIGFDAISLIGHSDAKKIHREVLIEQAVFYILKNRRNLTYTKAIELIEDLIKEDNITDFVL